MASIAVLDRFAVVLVCTMGYCQAPKLKFYAAAHHARPDAGKRLPGSIGRSRATLALPERVALPVKMPSDIASRGSSFAHATEHRRVTLLTGASTCPSGRFPRARLHSGLAIRPKWEVSGHNLEGSLPNGDRDLEVVSRLQNGPSPSNLDQHLTQLPPVF